MPREAATARQIALLRGINVGGHRVTMDRLRDLFAGLGFADVATFIASGNVIFTAPASDPAAIERTIEEHLARSLGYAVATFLRTPAEFSAVAAFRPFDRDEPGSSLNVGFLRADPGPEVAERVRSYRTDRDELRVEGRELYWFTLGRMSDSIVDWRRFEKELPLAMTVRNVTTVRRLAAKYPPA